jgi:hypothetical protein
VFGGVRWERIEGYLPAQQTPSSTYFPDGLVFNGVTINGVVQNYTVKKSFEEVRHDSLWHNWAPRVSMTYDLTGKGKTVVKASWGDYATRSTPARRRIPTPTSTGCTWNDLNGDFIFRRRCHMERPGVYGQ